MLGILNLVLLYIGCTLVSGSGIVSFNPVKLSMQRLKRNGNLTVLTSDFRTHPNLFKDALKLQPGQPFKVDINAWDDIATSGLFANLSAVSEVVEDGVCLNITGIELPSRFFEPKLGFTTSLDTPDPSGGVKFIDRNFRGVGESIELTATTRPRHVLNDDVQPEVHLLWRDCSLGKVSQTSVEITKSNDWEYGMNLMTVGERASLVGQIREKLKMAMAKILTRIKGVSVTMEKWFQLPALKGLTSSATGKVGLKPYLTVVEPLQPVAIIERHVDIKGDDVNNNNTTSTNVASDVQLAAVDSPTTLVGVKSFAEVRFERGLGIGVWHDGGYSRSDVSEGLSEYRQIGFTALSPTFHYPYRLSWTKRVKTFENATIQDETETQVLADGALGAQMRLSGMRSWGAGSLPLKHLDSMDAVDRVRCLKYSDKERSYGNRVDGFCMLQTDVFYDTKTKVGKVGLFTDTALYTNRLVSGKHDAKERGVTTLGFSWRTFGFKISIGNPLNGLMNKPRVHFGIDIEQ